MIGKFFVGFSLSCCKVDTEDERESDAVGGWDTAPLWGLHGQVGLCQYFADMRLKE